MTSESRKVYKVAIIGAGPAGVGVLVIKSSAKWRNPLPHNDLVRVPNSFSLPLVLASDVAMENYATQSDIRLKLKKVIIDNHSYYRIQSFPLLQR